MTCLECRRPLVEARPGQKLHPECAQKRNARAKRRYNIRTGNTLPESDNWIDDDAARMERITMNYNQG